MTENNTTMDITIRNTNNTFNELNKIKKLRHLEKSLNISDENNDEDINIILDDYIEFKWNFNDIYEIENDASDIMKNSANTDDVNFTRSKNLEIHQCLDNQNLLEKSRNNLENYSDSNCLCSELVNDVSLVKGDNFNIDRIQNNEIVFKRNDENEMTSCLKYSNKMDVNEYAILGLKISNEEFSNFVNSINFTNIFHIIFQDLLIILKNLNFYLNIKNDQINNFILTLEQVKEYEQKIITFNNVTNQILNKNSDIIYKSRNHKFELLYQF
ncbi:hypothetical protein NAPIS_ORF00857 [Vairimorpha apis BRL 01]|uniref:Uncharacterized protein n=1 Tax=Vairimorpha apis BRL 01 TaxID=1037528 RepID=T0MKP8_9MICR|nr:hypothetical protein NAPIS_ORF00857 [Vairimorpha apis BRL 01]